MKVANDHQKASPSPLPGIQPPASSLALHRPRDACPPSPQQDLPGLPIGQQKPALREGQPVSLDSPARCASIRCWEKPLPYQLSPSFRNEGREKPRQRVGTRRECAMRLSSVTGGPWQGQSAIETQAEGPPEHCFCCWPAKSTRATFPAPLCALHPMATSKKPSDSSELIPAV